MTVEDLGLPAVTRCFIGRDHVHRIAATLDTSPPADTLPLLWHWAFFVSATPTASLGADGHPNLDLHGPTLGLPSRMWIGGRVTSSSPLDVDEPAQRSSRIIRARRTEGKSGSLLLVSIEHRYEQSGSTRIVEEQDLAYRSPARSTELPRGDATVDPTADGWSRVVTVQQPLLFRFSALTFNSHRIHYDERYAMDVEGYPALVVHGPFTAILLAQATREVAGRDIQAFEFRAAAPLFAGLPFTIAGRTTSASAEARAVRNDGVDAMTTRMLFV